MKEQSNEIRRKGVVSFFWRSVIVAMLTMYVCTIFLMAQSGGITAKDAKAKEALAVAHKALGGADKIDDIKSFIISGTETRAVFTSMDQGPMTKTGSATNEFEIRVLLPDKIFQFEKASPLPGMSARTSYSIVSNGEFINLSIFDPPIPGMPPAKPASKDQIVINRQLQEMARLLVGTLMKAGTMPLTISSGSSPDRFTITTTEGGLCEVEFEAQGKYPSIVRYKVMETIFVRDPVTGNNTGETRMEERDEMMQFQEWAFVDGIMFPRVITNKAETMDREMRIEKVQINPKLTLKDFEIPEK